MSVDSVNLANTLNVNIWSQIITDKTQLIFDHNLYQLAVTVRLVQLDRLKANRNLFTIYTKLRNTPGLFNQYLKQPELLDFYYLLRSLYNLWFNIYSRGFYIDNDWLDQALNIYNRYPISRIYEEFIKSSLLDLYDRNIYNVDLDQFIDDRIINNNQYEDLTSLTINDKLSDMLEIFIDRDDFDTYDQYTDGADNIYKFYEQQLKKFDQTDKAKTIRQKLFNDYQQQQLFVI